ncbi:MAG: hypothetical protein EA377_04745 [Phycisphaerales bacterium]|nr:MAG: hypothetical protein EA377_04745 [Phycisphaerales bacterium]
MTDEVVIRECRTSDLDDLPHMVRRMTGRKHDYALLAEREGKVIAAGVYQPDGNATEPSHPHLRVQPVADASSLESSSAMIDVLPQLLDRLVQHARERQDERVTLSWDPMDQAGLRAVESAGFRAAGGGPYRELGGGIVQYVTGYDDASGAVIDLQRTL